MIVYCVNDAAVMASWGDAMKIAGSNLEFLADPNSELTKALGLVMDHPGPVGKLGPNRCKRHSMYVEDGVVKVIALSGFRRPAGDDDPSNSCIDSVLAKIAAL